MKDKFHKIFADDIVTFARNSAETNIFDISLNHLERLKIFGSIELHVAFYPYSRKISSREITIFPFEEDVRDISTNLRSVYTEIKSPVDLLFGVGLGVFIAFIIYLIKPENLYTVESIISIFGVYAIGKELWADIENGIVTLTKNWRLRYQKSYYIYQLERSSRLTKYSALAKKHRYKKLSLLPQKFDLLQQSNSLTLRMFFDSAGLQALDGNSAHIFSIHVDEQVVDELAEQGYMLGVKVSANTNFFGFTKSVEMFQSINNTRAADGAKISDKGCVTDAGHWVSGKMFYRNTHSLGRFKFFASRDTAQKVSLVTIEM